MRRHGPILNEARSDKAPASLARLSMVSIAIGSPAIGHLVAYTVQPPCQPANVIGNVYKTMAYILCRGVSKWLHCTTAMHFSDALHNNGPWDLARVAVVTRRSKQLPKLLINRYIELFHEPGGLKLILNAAMQHRSLGGRRRQ